ncbi:MAG TPA: hypothetical protein EYP43_00815, partial [Thermoplasmata archaeon]|nr:hypothetical protein [Thermoplasmata archaeon]
MARRPRHHRIGRRGNGRLRSHPPPTRSFAPPLTGPRHVIRHGRSRLRRNLYYHHRTRRCDTMDMEIEIISQRENVLLDRLEVEFRLAHPKERTPKRSVVRGQIAEALGVPKGQVIVDHMKTEFGISRTRGYA